MILPTHSSFYTLTIPAAANLIRSIAGAVAPFISAEYFVTEQIPLSANEPLSANARMVAYQ